MLSGLDRLAILAAMLGAMIVFYNQQQSLPQAPERRPAPILPAPPAPARPPTPAPAPPAAAPRWLDEPPIVVSTDAQSGTGTAFVVDSAGMWLTARHVAGYCRSVAILGPRGWIEVERAYSHPAADISVLATRGAPAGFALSRDEPRAGQLAYSFGFPRGQPGAVEHAYLGRSRMEMRGALSGIAPVTVWAERERWAVTQDHLGGISGGPLVDARGQLLGIHVAGSPRRGRTVAVAPEMIADAMKKAPAARDRDPAQLGELAITGPNATAVLNRLRGNFHIAKVYCQA